MSENQNIEQSKEEQSESQQGVNRETPKVNENMQEQTIKPIQPQSRNSKLQTEEMEVHHHPDLHHRKKHRKEYFLEFLTIFLAVTLGFFAENIRENQADRIKEKEYINSLIMDLRADTAQFASLIKYFIEKRGRLDSILQIPDNKNFINSHDLLNQYYFDLNSYQDFIYSDGTIEQLKNAGGFRLIENINVSDSITAYDKYVRYVERQQNLIEFGLKNVGKTKINLSDSI